VSSSDVNLILSGVEIVLGMGVLGTLIRARELRSFWPVLVISMWQVLPFVALLYVRRLGHAGVITARSAYITYYYTYWTSFASGAVCSILLTYTILHVAMAPLKGLQSLVKIVYYWAASISILVALNITFQSGVKTSELFRRSAVEFQRATGIITVSLAIFVCFAIRPMGLSLRSRIFGTSLGLVILNLTKTLQANYLMAQTSLFTTVTLLQTIISVVTQAIWIYYFFTPEPKSKFVLISTESPFHRWNAIAEQFGQSPGYVAIGGIPPDAFASAEIEIFHRASAKMNALATSEPGGTPEQEQAVKTNPTFPVR
jgi:hypothetical protein